MAKAVSCQTLISASTGRAVASSRSQFTLPRPSVASAWFAMPKDGCNSICQAMDMAASAAM
ncbi:hypothetical protein JYK14_01500 [Siccirubricoccus sp. KC 17139]|uniref:Uncharacterized protein n=1 Tax=Siccirubricoccus soli TaxID=2899147 RepID=A0ABT1CYW6_9PROT|nr:hypothetical protein [Siccirubricoccus soli]MCO6414852.1 hypothetical protein [Siccirubricoccus soli]MCP2680982.1 hypothetical protein [Siccirubricoccus soli]